MKAITIIIAALALSACGGSSKTEAEKAQEVYDALTEEEAQNLCAGFEFFDKEELIDMVMSPPNEHSRAFAEATYAIVEENC